MKTYNLLSQQPRCVQVDQKNCLKCVPKKLDIFFKIILNQMFGLIRIVFSVIGSIFGATFIRKRRRTNADPSADFFEIISQTLEPADKFNDDVPVKIDQIIGLQLNGGIDVELIRSVCSQLPFQKTLEIVNAVEEVGSFTLDMVIRAYLKIPRIANKRKFK